MAKESNVVLRVITTPEETHLLSVDPFVTGIWFVEAYIRRERGSSLNNFEVRCAAFGGR